MFKILYLCPLGLQHREWRLAAAAHEPGMNVVIRRSTETTHDELLELVRDADALITERTGEIDRAVIAAGVKLKLIHRHGSLAHDIDLAAAREYGVSVSVQPIRGTIAVAENVMLQTLAVLRRAMPLQAVLRAAPESFGTGPAPHAPRRTSEDVFAFNWSRQTRVGLLLNKTVGILGFGEIGAELARRLRGWGCSLLYSKRRRLPESVEAELGVSYREQESLLAESDVVVCLLPYFAETDMWLNAARIARMKPGAWLVGAGSGSVIDEAAVAAALRSGALAGASLDTYEWEPITPDNALLALANSDSSANVFLLPHIGSCNDAGSSQFEDLYGNVWSVLNGGKPAWRVA
ncbi:MAG: D-isomer specific 2-hydroxyacid dehydrogenase family protein [Chloroflexi bacterium]|nr:D-isomer specific 2-hydroxyacid dehydrogenase family protein [Chloroflexota bacterium]